MTADLQAVRDHVLAVLDAADRQAAEMGAGRATGHVDLAGQVVADLKVVLGRVVADLDLMRARIGAPAAPVQSVGIAASIRLPTHDICIAMSHQFRADRVNHPPNRRAVDLIVSRMDDCLAGLHPLLASERRSWCRIRCNALVVEVGKIGVLGEMLPAAAAVPDDSLVMRPHSAFVRDAFAAGDHDHVRLTRSMRRFYARLEKLKCMARDACRYRTVYCQYLSLMAGAVYYSGKPELARVESEALSVKPDIQMVKYMWNMSEQAAGRVLFHLTFPPIGTHFCFVVDARDLPDAERAVCADQPPVTCRFLFARGGLTLGESLSLCPSWPLSRDIWRNVQGPLALNGDPPGAVVLHFHGGGFVGQTSWSHQTYTRKWANSTGFPVLSCDYRLAPEHRFPAAVDDAWLCYLWVRAHAERCLGVPPSRIILAGDSAGGNLCAAIAVRAIQRNVPLPMGLLLAYPVMCVSRDVFYPSMLSCLEETMVPFGFLLVCLDAYVSDRREAISNPELSPGVATDDILQRFPPTRLMVGTNDPLLDQCIEFAERLRHLDRNVDLQVYPQFGHGFLSFDNLLVGIRQARTSIEQCNTWLRDLANVPTV
ncbi:unnamed protein product (mitochondrion) [Plasmodiophora brassicae]|uniref:Alpha/beta hydrolase fold-3 domain-containing protein n=1 Tax=Plasmodiophora brassicae TaxID=37360 RepID=A0A0G4J4P6_PLABS|nr:hypothetical protein PBRA_008923 [Plasmodiophora brassicae]SPQ93734.1 unnamed protein product [Plasmodiophora brassicae]